MIPEFTLTETEPEYRCVVRLRTTAWADGRGLHVKRSLTSLKRLSHGHDILAQALDDMSPLELAYKLINLDACDDGIYTMHLCNECRDWETGYIEDYDYRLEPYEANESLPTSED